MNAPAVFDAHNTPTLNRLNFQDLYFTPGEDAAYMTHSINGYEVLAVPPAVCEELKSSVAPKLKDLMTQLNSSEFSYTHNDGTLNIRYRISSMPTTGGHTWVLRKVTIATIDLAEINLPEIHRRFLSNYRASPGLVVIAGGPKAGKTTTASAVFKNWVGTGGIGVTLEDPPELPINGRVGKGLSFQLQVVGGRWDEALKNSLRYGSRYLFLGETRDAAAAREMARAALSNQTVISTLHADSIEAAAHTLRHIFKEDKSAHSALAAGIQAIVVQELKAIEGKTVPVVKEFLYVTKQNKLAVQAAIESGDGIRSLVEASQSQIAANFSKGPAPR